MPNKLTKFKIDLTFSPDHKKIAAQKKKIRLMEIAQRRDEEQAAIEQEKHGHLDYAPWLRPKQQTFMQGQLSPIIINEQFYLQTGNFVLEDNTSSYFQNIQELNDVLDDYLIRYANYLVTGSIVVTQYADHTTDPHAQETKNFIITARDDIDNIFETLAKEPLKDAICHIEPPKLRNQIWRYAV